MYMCTYEYCHISVIISWLMRNNAKINNGKKYMELNDVNILN